MPEPVLQIRNLKTYFYTYAGVVRALEGVDLDIYKGETLGLVGETGCGKSVTSLSIMRLVPDPPGRIVEGQILFKGEDLLRKSEEEMQRIRGEKITMVFQDPMTFINPVLTIGDQVSEVIMLHQDLTTEAIQTKIDEIQEKIDQIDPSSGDRQRLMERMKELEALKEHPPKPSKRETKKAALHKTIATLRLVQMPYPEKVIKQYPHELSGGMRQRAIIAIALSCNPDLLIADEPTTSLDVTIQAQILALLSELKKKIGASILIITHDMGIVAETCNRVGVMYAGYIIEISETKTLFREPMHPYTKGLLRAIPKLHKEVKDLEIITGSVPNLIYPPPGCRFHPRCAFKMDICDKSVPPLVEVKAGHSVACFLFPEVVAAARATPQTEKS
jgi:oligopeptide/dipeptide ABC transporter ATP-binding protein